MGRGGFAAALGSQTGARLADGHAVELIHNGRVFDAIEQEIGRASRTVHLAMYIWRSGLASSRVVRALAGRAAAGVRCRVLVDPVGTRVAFGEVREELERAGCEVAQFFGAPGLEPSRLADRNHRKLLVVDGRVGVTGGFCIWDKFLGDGLAKEEWRDTSVRVRGPAVAEMQRAFVMQWRSIGQPLEGADAEAPGERAGNVRAAFVASPGDHEKAAAEALTELVVASAEWRLWLAIGYFVPDEDWVERLARRVRHGVDVRVLVPGPVHDLRAVRLAQRATYEGLLRAGVRVWEYQPSMMHAKTMLADDWLGVVGSINLDPLSQQVVEEGALVVDSRRVAAELAARFRRDLCAARRVRRAQGPVSSAVGRLLHRSTLAVAGFAAARRRRLLRAGS